MVVIKKVLANVAQSLLPNEQSQARSNIGIEPHTVSPSGMAFNTVYWTNKAQGDQWREIGNPGVSQSLFVYGGKPTIVSVSLIGKAFGDFESTVNTVIVGVRLIGINEIFDSVYIAIPVNPANTPGIQVPYNIIFMNATPKEGHYVVEASCQRALTSTQYVYLGGSATGNVKSMSCL
jgi:hypothetical protein